MTPEEKYKAMIREARRRTGWITQEQQFGDAVLRYYQGDTYKWFHREGGRDITQSLRKPAVLELLAKALKEEGQ